MEGVPLKALYIGEVTYSVSGAGVYGAQSVINLQIVNRSLLPRPYRLYVVFYRGEETVDKKQSVGLLMPKKSTYVTLETYQMTDHALVSLKPLFRPLPYDEKEVTPS